MAPSRVLEGELLSQHSAPGQPEDVGAAVVQLGQDAAGCGRELGQLLRDLRHRGLTYARYVEQDDLDAVERFGERNEYLQWRTHAVQHQQWWPRSVTGKGCGPYPAAHDLETPNPQPVCRLAGRVEHVDAPLLRHQRRGTPNRSSGWQQVRDRSWRLTC